MMSKLKAEEDMSSGDVQAQLRCYVHHLTGKAREQVENYIDDDGVVGLGGTEDLVSLIKSAFGDVDEKGSAQRKIAKLKQGHQLLITFMAEWQALAAKSGFEDTALTFFLREAIHPKLAARLALSPPPKKASWRQYVDLVRDADAIERSLDSNYHSKGNDNSGPKNNSHNHIPQRFTTPIDPDAMDLSKADLSVAKINISQIGWTEKDIGRRPTTDDEKMAKKVYCMVNKLCNWCYSKEHMGDTCPEAIWNKGKAFYTGGKRQGKASS